MIDIENILKTHLTKLKTQIINSLASDGTVLSKSTQDKMVVYADMFHGYIEVPFWFPVFQDGRAPRKRTENHQLWKKIYKWMEKKNMFVSSNIKKRIIEAKSLTWYINKHGTKLFRKGGGRDIYTSLIPIIIAKIQEESADYWLLQFEKVFKSNI